MTSRDRDYADESHREDRTHEPGRTKKLRLDQYLKLKGLVFTGGEAKVRIQSGEVEVNGELETRRGRGLRPGDVIAIDDVECVVEDELFDDDGPTYPDED